MARGDVTLFEELAKVMSTEMDLAADTISVRLLNDFSAFSAADTTPQWGDYSANEVSGSNYTAGGNTIACTYNESNGVATFAGPASTGWTQHASGPNNIEVAAFVNDTSTGQWLIGFMDMTVDAGVTPISLQDGDITINFNPTIFTTTVT